MKLLNLALENFQGLKAVELVFDGKNASIYGDNATGKTTLFNAVTWLLFDKASTGARGFTPKTKAPDGDIHYLGHAVEARFIAGGRELTLRKVYKEVYKKKRGSPVEEFDGHTTDFFVDDVPSSEKEYLATLRGIGGDAEKMKTLAMPWYFAEELPWEQRRRILLEVCGDVGDAAVISSNPELAGLADVLRMPGGGGLYSVDDYRKIAGAKKTEINRELQGIPGRVDEATRAMPDVSGVDKDAVDREIKKLTKQKETLAAEKAQTVSSDTLTLSARTHVAEVSAKLAEARAAHAASGSRQNDETYAAMAALKKEQLAASNRLADAKTDLTRARRLADSMANLRESLIAEYKAIQAETWDEAAATCPTCHRGLPEEKVQELREAFNLRKSNRLEEINQRGQTEASLALIAAEIARAEELVAKVAEAEKAVERIALQMAILHGQLQEVPPFEATTEYAELTAKITASREEAKDLDKQMQELTQSFTNKIQELQNEIQAQNELKSRFAVVANQQKRIAELAAREKELAKQYEDLERGIYLCELFIKTKVSLLTDRINSKFQSVSFRLFIEQVNGGIREDCEVMIPNEGGSMVPYAFANHGARVNAGLEIIDTLSKHWGLTMPVIIDNAESVTQLLPVDTQVIRLVVSEQDKTLRLEIH